MYTTYSGRWDKHYIFTHVIVACEMLGLCTNSDKAISVQIGRIKSEADVFFQNFLNFDTKKK